MADRDAASRTECVHSSGRVVLPAQAAGRLDACLELADIAEELARPRLPRYLRVLLGASAGVESF